MKLPNKEVATKPLPAETLNESVGIALYLVVSIALAWLAYSFGGMDFNVYYAAAHVTLEGGNPYDYQQLAPYIISSSGSLNNPYYYAVVHMVRHSFYVFSLRYRAYSLDGDPLYSLGLLARQLI